MVNYRNFSIFRCAGRGETPEDATLAAWYEIQKPLREDVDKDRSAVKEHYKTCYAENEQSFF